MNGRPLGVTIIGILLMIEGLFWIYGGYFGGMLLNLRGFEGLAGTVSIFLMLVGILNIFFSAGFLMGKPVFWAIAVFMTLINILSCLFVFFFRGGTGIFLILVVALCTGFYLTRPGVKKFFSMA